jgi:AcrR family transcriptional regulator
MKREEKIQRITKGCIPLFIEKGVSGTSIKMISASTGVSNGSIFHHFENKDAIVKAIYFNIKTDLHNYLKNKLPADTSFRQYIHHYWFAVINWYLDHPQKREFINMFSRSPVIKRAHLDNELKLCDFVFSRIKTAIADGEILTYDFEYFMFNFNGVAQGVVNYINAHPEQRTNEFLENAFSQYWRSIVNF